jgi:agmatine deiminase
MATSPSEKAETTPDMQLDWRMPAEWEPHEATWIAWPHNEEDWPDKIEPVRWAFTEIARALAPHERVEILCHNEEVQAEAEDMLEQAEVKVENCRCHQIPSDRSWTRDACPTGVFNNDGHLVLVNWRFNGWALYKNFEQDARIGDQVTEITGCKRVKAYRPDKQDERLILEGGAIDVNGNGTLLTTEECLLSTEEQVRNPGMSRKDYEKSFAAYLGIRKTIWLGGGVEGDDTHGHVDDVARFVGPDTVVLAYEEDPKDDNHAASVDNFRRLQSATTADGRSIRVVQLPMPEPVMFEGYRLPASYANFYIANNVVLVPTFNDPNDRVALNTLAELIPDRKIIPIYARDLVWGEGTLHCLTQQQPLSH